MAGLGRRIFAPGEVLTASNTMNYLMDQTVMNFAGTAARGSAIGTAVSEGMVSYLADTNAVEVYTGSTWTNILTSASSLGAAGSSGYIKFSNGIIIQWGNSPSVANNTAATFTFPIAFPNALLSLQAIPSAGAGFSSNKGCTYDANNTTNMSVSHAIGATTNMRIIAIGY